jgi:hypothetical protein
MVGYPEAIQFDGLSLTRSCAPRPRRRFQESGMGIIRPTAFHLAQADFLNRVRTVETLTQSRLAAAVDQTGASWNQVASWLRQLECLHRSAV